MKMYVSLLLLLITAPISFVQAQNCVDSSLIQPDGICFDVYIPVCGCNGITYTNSCYAEILGGVIDFTPGPCAGDIIDAEPCTDVAAVDFGDCDMALGITIINGQCAFVSGCGFVVDDINYAPAFYNTIEACEACFKTEPIDAEPCTNLANIDFGPCSMFIGYALNGGQCLPMSGCGTVVNNVNYQNALYATEAECELCLSSNGISDDAVTAIVLYPNPTQDMLHIVSKIEINHIIIYNSAGNEIFVSSTAGQEFSLDIRNWGSGLYFIQIQTVNGIITSKVLVH